MKKKKVEFKKNLTFLPYVVIFLFLQFSFLSDYLTDLYLLPLFYFFFFTPSIVGFGAVTIFSLLSDSFSPIFFLNTVVTLPLFYLAQKQKVLSFEKEIYQLYLLFFVFILLFVLSKNLVLELFWGKHVSNWIYFKPFTYTILFVVCAFFFNNLKLKYIKDDR